MQNWSILTKFAKKKSSKIGCFLLIVSWRSFPQKFPVKSADFSKNLPLKILRNLTFFAKIPRNRLIFLPILTFPPAKSADFPLNFAFFSREISRFSTNSPLKILRNFAFFSAKYQKPCLKHDTWPFHYVPVLSLQSIKTNNWSADNL